MFAGLDKCKSFCHLDRSEAQWRDLEQRIRYISYVNERSLHIGRDDNGFFVILFLFPVRLIMMCDYTYTKNNMRGL